MKTVSHYESPRVETHLISLRLVVCTSPSGQETGNEPLVKGDDIIIEEGI